MSKTSKNASSFTLAPTDNPQMHTNEIFPAYENLHDPRCAQLREKYNLDAVVENETDELKRILLFRHWMFSNITIDNDIVTPTRGDAFAVLDSALQGGTFQCAYFSIVQHAILNSFGYVARRLGNGHGQIARHDLTYEYHSINEVWLNSYCKWMAIDAKYDAHFEKNNIPLSALEIRDEIIRNNAQDVDYIIGPNRDKFTGPFTFQQADLVPYYLWNFWELNTNNFTDFPNSRSSAGIVYEDEYTRNNTWYRESKPFWAYDTGYMIWITDRNWINWTPNIIKSTVDIQADNAHIKLTSNTPNFKTYQYKTTTDADWQNCIESLDLKIPTQGLKLTFRTVNLVNVTGPEHNISIMPST